MDPRPSDQDPAEEEGQQSEGVNQQSQAEENEKRKLLLEQLLEKKKQQREKEEKENQQKEEKERQRLKKEKQQREKEGQQPTIRVGKIKFNGQVKHFAIVPREKLHSRSELQDLMDFWGLPVPSFIIETNFSDRNAQDTITKENVDNLVKRVYPQPFFQYHTEEDKKAVEEKPDTKQPILAREEKSEQLPFYNLHKEQKRQRTQSVKTTWRNVRKLPPSQPHIEESEWEEFANTYLHQKLEKSLSAMVSAADMTGGWILCRGPPTTNEKLLENAIESTRSTQTVLVVDDPENYENADLRRIFNPIEDNEYTTAITDALDSSKMAKKMESFLLYDEYDCQQKKTTSADGGSRDQQGIAATKGKNMSGLDVQLWKQEAGSWEAKFPWKKGDYFIFTNDSENFNADLIGPSGYIAINGNESELQDTHQERGLSTGHMIRESLSRVRPCLIFDNTGREAQMYAKLIREIIWRDDLKRTLVVLENLIRDAPVHEKKVLELLRPTNSTADEKKTGPVNNHPAQRSMSAPAALQQAAETTTGSEEEENYKEKSVKFVLYAETTTGSEEEENYKEKSVEFVLYKLNNGIEEYRERQRKRRRNHLWALVNYLYDLVAWIISICWFWSCRCGCSPEEKIDEERYYRKLRMDLKKYAGPLMRIANADHFHKNNIGDWFAYVHHCIDLYCENPRLFRKVVVPVDPVDETGDEIVGKMALSFARANFEAREVGAGEADATVVEQSWRFHFQLNQSLKTKKLRRDMWYLLYIVAGLAAVVVAVVQTTELLEDIQNADFAMQYAAAILAALAAISTSMLSATSADTHLQQIIEAESKVVKEIFYFRMRIGKYSLHEYEKRYEKWSGNSPTSLSRRIQKYRGGPEGHSEPQSELAETQNISKAMHDARLRFSDSIQEIFRDLASVDLYPRETDDLRGYVRSTLKIQDAGDKLDRAIVTGVLSPEDYQRFRLRPLLDAVEYKENSLRKRTRILQLAGGICSGAAIVLGALEGAIVYLPIAVAAATACFQFLKVQDYERRFRLATTAARELRSLDTKWAGLSDLDKQLRPSIVALVKTCEDLAQQFETSSAIQVDKNALGMNQPLLNLSQQAKPSFESGAASNV